MTDTVTVSAEHYERLVGLMEAAEEYCGITKGHKWAEGFESVGQCSECLHDCVCTEPKGRVDECENYAPQAPVEGMADLRGTVEPVGVTYSREAVQDWVTHAEMHDYVEKAITRALYPRRASQDDGDAE